MIYKIKKTLSTFCFFSIFICNGYSQLDKTNNQAGISTLPIFDVLKVFPKNKISGIAFSGNFGYFALKHMSIGIQPYYAQVSNVYTTSLLEEQKQNIKLYGVNTYLRYYFISIEKFSIYAIAGAGFGNSDQITTNLSPAAFSKNSHTDKSIFTSMLGVGINYFIVNNLALELIIPYINVKYISTGSNDMSFQTAAPTIGLQFYWK